MACTSPRPAPRCSAEGAPSPSTFLQHRALLPNAGCSAPCGWVGAPESDLLGPASAACFAREPKLRLLCICGNKIPLLCFPTRRARLMPALVSSSSGPLVLPLAWWVAKCQVSESPGALGGRKCKPASPGGCHPALSLCSTPQARWTGSFE